MRTRTPPPPFQQNPDDWSYTIQLEKRLYWHRFIRKFWSIFAASIGLCSLTHVPGKITERSTMTNMDSCTKGLTLMYLLCANAEFLSLVDAKQDVDIAFLNRPKPKSLWWITDKSLLEAFLIVRWKLHFLQNLTNQQFCHLFCSKMQSIYISCNHRPCEMAQSSTACLSLTTAQRQESSHHMASYWPINKIKDPPGKIWKLGSVVKNKL